jgi:molecular chaperone HscA
MALLQIAEPGQSPQPHQRRLAVGIDLGTTNSLVAALRSGREPLADARAGSSCRPRCATSPIASKLARRRGWPLQRPAEHRLSVKRLMGRGLADVKQLGEQLPYRFVGGESHMPFIDTVQGPKSPVEVSADILKVLRSVPKRPGWRAGRRGDHRAGLFRRRPAPGHQGCALAGLNVLRLLNEPTAAAVAYGLDQNAEGVVAIYDLGGGTFDISILRLTGGVFEVLATGGDTALGGDDFDHAIAGWIIEQAGLSADLDPATQRALLQTACAAKEALTDADVVSVSHGAWQGELTRAAFDAMIEPMVARSLKACRRAVRDSGVELEEVSAVVMVGGSTRVPRVREAVGALFGRTR